MWPITSSMVYSGGLCDSSRHGKIVLLINVNIIPMGKKNLHLCDDGDA
jgi:hypothetical protein